MKLFINSADAEEIREAYSLGIVDGVTTNPSNTAKMGRNYKENLIKICEIVDGPVCAQVRSTAAEDMVKEAKIIDSLHKNTLVKIPMNVEGIKAIRILTGEGIKVNTTVVFSVAQAILACRAGTNYISLFTGPYASRHDIPINLTQQVKKIVQNYNFNTLIIDCVRSPQQTVEAALAGADICTMDYAYLKLLFESPMTNFYMKLFHDAWEKAYQDKTWLSDL